MQILFSKAFEVHSTLKIEVNTQTRGGFLELQELRKKEFPLVNEVNQISQSNDLFFSFF